MISGGAVFLGFALAFAPAAGAQSPQQTATQRRGAPSISATATPKGPGQTARRFLKQAHLANAAEIQLGHMAEAKGAKPDVKQFGARMVADHTRNDEKLKALAAAQGVSLPAELDQPHKDMKARLSVLAGAKFDQAYALEMVQAHEKAVRRFRAAARGSDNPAVSQYARASLPMLESHLRAARAMQKAVAGARP